MSDKLREKDIQDLCQSVINMSANVYYNSNGTDESTCPMCYEKDYSDHGDMAKIKHAPNCGYHIAKDLSTKRE